ncbi:unnamed protein product [Rotaria sp. Silwood1]|nr:unnamed protein product [Rotaria sp. Silwood1]CAF5099713.1 unnamed protein product [Rotaria sp. Silwood1]
MEELIRSPVKFDGALTSNKYVGVQYFLTDGAATWFRYNKANISDWLTFKREKDKYLRECEQLEQQGESVINYDFVTTDVEDTFEGFTRTMNSLTTNDSLSNTDLSQDVQYL